MSDISRYIKNILKITIYGTDSYWPLFRFEQSVNPETWKHHDAILEWAEQALTQKKVYEAEEKYLQSEDPTVQQGFKLKHEVTRAYKNKYANTKNIRILIHVPDQYKSPAGYSLFTNFAEAFAFIGIPVALLGWNDPIENILTDFKPTVFLSSDHVMFLSRINWEVISNYKKTSRLDIGLTASLQEYGNSALSERLAWAKNHDVKFYYTFRDLEYVHGRKEYQPFFDAGYKILPLMFGANINIYYPVPNISRDLPYVFLASQNGAKGARYDMLMKDTLHEYPGFIDGPGWRKIKKFSFNRDRDRYIYARARVGINIHLNEQIEWACEVNERTYMLAACGVPQVIDNAKLLPKLFSLHSLFVASNPEEYKNYCDALIKDPSIGTERALQAQREVFARHTTFHRVENFIQALTQLLAT